MFKIWLEAKTLSNLGQRPKIVSLRLPFCLEGNTKAEVLPSRQIEVAFPPLSEGVAPGYS